MAESDELVCHECGTINDRERVFCELCEDPLDDERREQPKRAFLGDLVKALGATVPIYWMGSIPTRAWVAYALETASPANLTLRQFALSLQAPRGGGFWFMYTMAVVLVVVVAPYARAYSHGASPLSIWQDWGEDKTRVAPRGMRTTSPATRQFAGCIYAWTVGVLFWPFAYLNSLWGRALRQFGVGGSDSS